MIEIDENLIGIWFVTLPGNHGFDNWLGALMHVPGGGVRLVHRFRYCDPLEPGADPYENLDRKSEYEGSLAGPADEALRIIREVSAKMAALAGEPVQELLMNPERDLARFARDLMAQPWAHAHSLA